MAHHHFARDDRVILASQDEARFILSSVLENAINFSPKNSTIHVTASSTNNKIHLSVKDNGQGISSDKLAELFKPFARASDTLQYDHEGLGLGLYTNKLLVEKLGGSIKISSYNNTDNNVDNGSNTSITGTTVSISLPISSNNEAGMSSGVIVPT